MVSKNVTTTSGKHLGNNSGNNSGKEANKQMPICINRCVCTDMTFDQLLTQAEREGLSLPQLAECTTASRNCGMCGPYLRRAFRTGETVFHQIITDADEPKQTAAEPVVPVAP